MSSSVNQQTARKSSRGSLIALLIVLAIAALILWQRVLIVDSILAWRYQPSQDIAAITSAINFSPDGKRIFYASSPEIDGTSTFNAECGNTEKTSVVLGCYKAGKIYVYQVDNDELAGVEEVTAAHEMLHAAYERLSTSERQRINSLLETEAAERLNDDAFKERMSVYNKLSDEERINELHSVIGTEVDTITPELETYYEQYFTNRAAVVAMYNDYHSVLVNLQNEAIALGKSLDAQAAAINSRVDAYNQAADDLDAAITQFNSRARGEYFKTQTEFDIARAELVDQSAALEAERVSINQAIKAYDADKRTFDALSSHLTELTNSIDSTLAPAPSVSGEL
ncbi:hypothetical protein EOL96_03715 [Candidatus Saccharibacteria bacterium]|nr:hypothetical protein [Candidatus Saccharibacteria bacterium]